MPTVLFHHFTHIAVFPPEEQQRIPIPQNHIFHLGDEDRMVSGLFCRLQVTFQVCQRPMEHGCSMTRAVKARAGLHLGMLVRTLRTRIVLGDRALFLAENIDAKTLLGV